MTKQHIVDEHSLSYGVMHRLPRISPDVPIQYRQHTIPPGIPVGMSNYFMHTDADVFPDPLEFRPERWTAGITPEMIRNYVPFGRGSRNCLGQQYVVPEKSCWSTNEVQSRNCRVVYGSRHAFQTQWPSIGTVRHQRE
jgi:hypothetical protein